MLRKFIEVTYMASSVKPAVVDGRGEFASLLIDFTENSKLFCKTLVFIVNSSDRWQDCNSTSFVCLTEVCKILHALNFFELSGSRIFS